MNPQYTDDYLTRLYALYNAPETATEMFGPPPKGREHFLPTKRDKNIELISRFARRGKFLAIGCGSGDEMRAAIASGWQVEGYDVDPVATAEVAERLGVPVYSGSLATSIGSLPAHSYDCVYLDQVLEHPKDPAEYLRLAHRLLKPDGVLYLGVPNIRSVSSIFKIFLGKRGWKAFRGRHYDSWHHLFYYSPASLKFLLSQIFSFDVLLVGGDPVPTSSGVKERLGNWLRERFAFLDSSFRVLARPT